MRNKQDAGARDHRPACNFCGRLHAEVTKLIAGPDVNICDGCAFQFNEGLLEQRLPQGGKPKSTRRDEKPSCCDFCGKREDETDALCGSGTGVLICDECIELCCEIADEAASRNFTLPDAMAQRLDRAHQELEDAESLMGTYRTYARGGVVLTRMALISTVEALAHCKGPLTPLREYRDSLLQQIDECAALAPLEPPGYRDLVVNADFVYDFDREQATEIYRQAKHSIIQVRREALKLLREQARETSA